MSGGGFPGHPGPAGRYLSGLCAAAVGLCAAGWLVLTPYAFGYRGRSHDAKLTDLATGGGLAVVCLVTMIAWAVAWRRALRADGVLTRKDRARRRRDRAAAASVAADPDQILATLRTMLEPLLVSAAPPGLDVAPTPAEGAGADADPVAMPAPGQFTVLAGGVIPEPRNGAEMTGGIAVIESMLADAEARPGLDEEETW